MASQLSFVYRNEFLENCAVYSLFLCLNFLLFILYVSRLQEAAKGRSHGGNYGDDGN